ncbi:MAG TPA: DUF2066 domain-containing protein [Steroidobacteraceae bacterium]|nr:DUF2066 domain-containing protein [Steroidobacteraceae bacterium]
MSSAICLRLVWAAVCLAGGVLCMLPAQAEEHAKLYQAAVPVTDRSDGSREAGFQAAMQVVLVRVTGTLSAGANPAYAALVAAADRYVQQYRYAPDGRLVVGFDGGAIERWLTQNAAPVWGRTRPVTLVLLTAPNGQSGAIVTRDDSSDLKAAIDAQAALRGIGLLWPSAQELTNDGLDYSTVSGAHPTGLQAIAKRQGADGVLIGHATDLGATAGVQWLFEFQTQSGQAAGTVEGVNLAADDYAAIYAVSGAYSPVDVEVDGIKDLRAYARILRLFESLTPVSQVTVLALDGDSVSFRLDARGGAAPLERTLALNGALQLEQATGAAGELHLQLRR